MKQLELELLFHLEDYAQNCGGIRLGEIDAFHTS